MRLDFFAMWICPHRRVIALRPRMSMIVVFMGKLPRPDGRGREEQDMRFRLAQARLAATLNFDSDQKSPLMRISRLRLAS